MITRHVDFHDSEVVAIEHAARNLVVVLNGYIHQWEYDEAGGGKGSGWTQLVRLQLEAGRGAGSVRLPARVSDGELVARGSTLKNLVPLPYKCIGPIELHLSTPAGDQVSVLADSISVCAEGEATLVEALTDDVTQAPIHVVPYDPAWPAKFRVERAMLEELISPWVVGGIEHVGSTAVPGLSSKPVIDVMVGVSGLVASKPARAILVEHGYGYAEYKTDVMHWLCKPSSAFRTHHIHLIPHDSQLWHERLRFRDLLRADRTVAREYEALKLDLARRYEFDREAYTDAKYPFIQRVLQQA